MLLTEGRRFSAAASTPRSPPSRSRGRRVPGTASTGANGGPVAFAILCSAPATRWSCRLGSPHACSVCPAWGGGAAGWERWGVILPPPNPTGGTGPCWCGARALGELCPAREARGQPRRRLGSFRLAARGKRRPLADGVLGTCARRGGHRAPASSLCSGHEDSLLLPLTPRVPLPCPPAGDAGLADAAPADVGPPSCLGRG